jgi:hypothetical protein
VGPSYPRGPAARKPQGGVSRSAALDFGPACAWGRVHPLPLGRAKVALGPLH